MNMHKQDSITYDRVLLRPTEQIGLHSQAEWELSYIIKGSGSRILGDETEHFYQGEIVLVIPEMRHQWNFDTDDTDDNGFIENITVTFRQELLEGLSSLLPEMETMVQWYGSLAQSVRFTRQMGGDISLILRRMELETAERRIISLLEILNMIYAGKRYQLIGHQEDKDSVLHKMEKARIYINCNFMKDISIDDISLHIGMNRSSLCTAFKKLNGRTIVQFITEKRLEVAKKMLREGRENIATCCYHGGFKDVPHFNRIFKSIVGMSPSEYRKKHLESFR